MVPQDHIIDGAMVDTTTEQVSTYPHPSTDRQEGLSHRRPGRADLSPTNPVKSTLVRFSGLLAVHHWCDLNRRTRAIVVAVHLDSKIVPFVMVKRVNTLTHWRQVRAGGQWAELLWE